MSITINNNQSSIKSLIIDHRLSIQEQKVIESNDKSTYLVINGIKLGQNNTINETGVILSRVISQGLVECFQLVNTIITYQCFSNKQYQIWIIDFDELQKNQLSLYQHRFTQSFRELPESYTELPEFQLSQQQNRQQQLLDFHIEIKTARHRFTCAIRSEAKLSCSHGSLRQLEILTAVVKMREANWPSK